MFQIDIDILPLFILISTILQIQICIFAKRNRFLIGVLPLVFFVFAGYGYVADRMVLPYPGLFEKDFMLSSALAGFFCFWLYVYWINTGYDTMGRCQENQAK